MNVAGTGMRVVVATRPVDFRKGHDGLAAVVEQECLSQTHAGAAKINRCHRRNNKEIITPSVTPDQHPSVAPLTRTWVAPLGRSATGWQEADLERDKVFVAEQ